MATSRPVIVLIPGSFHPPAVWTNVAGNLRRRGYEVLTPALVSTGAPVDPSVLASLTCEDDAAAVLKELTPVLDDCKEAVVLGHSYGSIVAATVCRDNTVEERAAKGLKGGIRGLVSLGGYAFPVRGKNVFGTDGPAPDISWNVVKDGISHIKDEAKGLFFNDMPEDEQDAAWEMIYRVHSRAALAKSPSYIAADAKVLKTWILTEKDLAIPPEVQSIWIKPAGFDKVLKIDAGHDPMFSQPERLTELIVEAASR